MSNFDDLKNENKKLKMKIEKLLEENDYLLGIKNHLEAVVENLPVVLYVLDKEGKFLLSRGGGLKELGLKPNQVVGMSVFDVYKEFPAIITAHRNALKGIEGNYTFNLHGKQNVLGTETIIEQHYDARIRPLYNEEGEFYGVIGIAHDTTHLRLVERKLRESESNYSTLIESSPLGVLVMQQGIIKYANPSLLNLFGYSSLEEIINEPSTNLLPPGEIRDELLKRSINREKGELEPTSYDTLGLKKDGTIFPIHIKAKKINYNDSPSVMSYFRDLSNLNRLAEEKRKLQEQLLIAQKVESLGVVAGGVAHDFNNLLLGIIGNASLLEKRISENMEALNHVEQIQKISEEASNLTKQMLAYTGKSVSNKGYMSLNEVIIEINKLISLSVPKSIIIRYDLSQTNDKIFADKSQIKQIILNLVINASEAIGRTNGNITIITGNQEIDTEYKDQFPVFNVKEGNYSFVKILDNGEGIEKSEISKIFDPFYSTKFTGRGLGLSVVHGIVKSHNGVIKVYSEPHKGSSFKVFFPIAEFKKATEPIKKHFESISEYRTGKILFCDDEESVRDIGEKMLEYLGFTPILASDGLEGLKIFEKLENDIILVILDLTMPIMSGKETLSKIRQINPDKPVIISSGYNEIEVIEMFRGRKNIDFLQKPYSLSKLKSKILECLDKAK